ncbi:conserved hypothetical protein [Cotesia vestalis bracovirus]|nr:conserved hypothetical protein [Cotesia vestalis bracovirus]
MVFNKTLIVLLLAILGTSWIPDGRSNGLASACWSRTTRPDRCEEKKNPTGATTEIPKEVTTKVPTIDDIPQEDEEFAPLTVGIWVEDKYYRLPNARYYKVEIKEGTARLPDGRTNVLAFGWFGKSVTVIRCEEKKNPTEATTEIPKEVFKESTTKVPTIDDIPQEDEEFAPLTVGIWIVDKYYRLPNAPYYKLDIKEGTSRSTTHLPNPYYKGGPIIIKD